MLEEDGAKVHGVHDLLTENDFLAVDAKYLESE